MPEIEIKQGSKWVYVGPGEGRKEIHFVTLVDGGEVTTISDPNARPLSGIQMWNGPLVDFRRHFIPARE